ncbi:hypothetical protein llap_8867 [Limosa lapponica baueri]|uniref:Uncharacterized protein n=1 Tax=Limosa lapponica baueri TaxID=1758121 RepID=A0A2I0U413_LIMLA|nr:hypothetical protein llap_8867 [Limosa lapponica baueri]
MLCCLGCWRSQRAVTEAEIASQHNSHSEILHDKVMQIFPFPGSATWAVLCEVIFDINGDIYLKIDGMIWPQDFECCMSRKTHGTVLSMGQTKVNVGARQIILKSWKSNYKWNGTKWYSGMSELRILALILYYMRGKTEDFEEM